GVFWITMRSGGVDVAHGEAHATLAVDLEHLHAHVVAFLELVRHALHALLADLRDMHQAVAARENRDERAEIHQANDLAFVDAADFDVRRDQLDAALGFAARGARDAGDLDRAIVLDVDRGAGLFGDLADDRATLADDVADLLRVDLERDDRRRPVGHLVARGGDDLVHLAEDVQAAFLRLRQRDLHDLGRDALD